MDHFEQTRSQIRTALTAVLLIEGAVLLGIGFAIDYFTTFSTLVVLGAIGILVIPAAFIGAAVMTRLSMAPLLHVWQTLLHLSPDGQGVAAPDPAKLKIGRDMVVNVIGQIHQLATNAENIANTARKESLDLHRNFVANNLPLPLITLDASETITFANKAAAEYIGIAAEELTGKNVYMILDMSFPNNDTFDTWLKEAKEKTATSNRTWERVRLNVRDNHPTRLFDLAGFYNKDNTFGVETMLVLFDHTKQYSQDEQAVSFIALSVHELRTPLTLLRGYIEVFEEELANTSNPELKGFMDKMSATSQQLMAFVNNILNVARVDDDQLELQLHEENWKEVLEYAIEGIRLRAKVRGITIECAIDDNLPTVGIDRISIYEVVNNLVDNAIKYSGTSQIVKIEAHLTKDGMVETTIQDFGLGISTSIMPNLFTKFYRDHRNRAQIGGTGLGLYLSKAIVTAHGGNLSVRSKENEGSTFGFTLMPYASLSAETKLGSKEITRGAHGWIKNHSMYRR